MRIALAQFLPLNGNIDSNLSLISNFAGESAKLGAHLLCLPEMCTTGFAWSQLDKLLKHSKASQEQISNLAQQNKISIVGSFLTKNSQGKPNNSFIYFESDGSVLVDYNKIHLFRQMGEDLHLEAGAAVLTAQSLDAHIGCSICYDLRFPELFRKCALAGAELQILPAAFPHPRLTHWRALLQARAMENQNFIIATNQCGTAGDDQGSQGTHYCGHSMVVHPSGEILFEAGEESELGIVDIDLGDIQRVRETMHCLRDLRTDLY